MISAPPPSPQKMILMGCGRGKEWGPPPPEKLHNQDQGFGASQRKFDKDSPILLASHVLFFSYCFISPLIRLIFIVPIRKYCVYRRIQLPRKIPPFMIDQPPPNPWYHAEASPGKIAKFFETARERGGGEKRGKMWVFSFPTKKDW